MSAKQCIKNKIFDHIRVPELEKPAPFKINLDIDSEGSYDYDNNVDLKYQDQSIYR